MVRPYALSIKKLNLEAIYQNYQVKIQLLLTVCYYHVTYEFQSESTLYSLPECQGTPYLKQAPFLNFK